MQNFNPVRGAAFSVPAVGAERPGSVTEIRMGVCVPFTGDISIKYKGNVKPSPERFLVTLCKHF